MDRPPLSGSVHNQVAQLLGHAILLGTEMSWGELGRPLLLVCQRGCIAWFHDTIEVQAARDGVLTTCALCRHLAHPLTDAATLAAAALAGPESVIAPWDAKRRRYRPDLYDRATSARWCLLVEGILAQIEHLLAFGKSHPAKYLLPGGD